MAYSIIRTEMGDNGGSGFYTEYICDSVEDVATLPTDAEYGGPRPGSLALVGTEGTIYILTNDMEWSEFSMSGGGGGGGGTGGNLVVGYEMDESGQYMTLDKTAGEIVGALQAGRTVVMPFDMLEDESPYLALFIFGGVFGEEYDGVMYYFLTTAEPLPYGDLWFASPDDYPTSAPPDSPEPPADEGLH